MTLYNELKEAGIPLSSHESDLYFKSTPESLAILEKYPLQRRNSTRFKNNLNGEIWMDVPFSYDPWWAARRSTSCMA
jgi:hypothetical protein